MKIAKIAKTQKNYQKNNIAIIGHMGSGKSLIGKLIAKDLNYEHIDSDKLIEKNINKSINDIFLEKGENYFRKIEENSITKLYDKNNLVLSLGGGSILSKKVRDFLFKYNFVTLFLDVDLEILQKRLINSKKRPLLFNVNIGEKLKELDSKRRKFYLLADIKLKNCDDPNQIVSIFLENYKKLKNNK
tara:strand:+ start:1094 stop:1654 length:561 start_codon:yes stop_codon:yes gene_type:complete